MRSLPFFLAALAALAGCRASAPDSARDELPVAAAAAESAGRPRDPWVFRSVLDGNARMVTLALHPRAWMAIDAERGAIWKVWDGDVRLTGTVYDTLHGPQPTSRGPMYFAWDDGVSATTRGAAGLRFATGEPARLTWRGYRFGPADAAGRRGVDLAWTLDRDGRTPVEFVLSPDAREEGGATILVLSFRVDGLGEGERVLLDLPAVREPLTGSRRSSDAVTIARGTPTQPSALSIGGAARIEFRLPRLEPLPEREGPSEGPFVAPDMSSGGLEQ